MYSIEDHVVWVVWEENWQPAEKVRPPARSIKHKGMAAYVNAANLDRTKAVQPCVDPLLLIPSKRIK
jgi:hypothetical protein